MNTQTLKETMWKGTEGIDSGIDWLHHQIPGLSIMSQKIAEVTTDTRDRISNTSAYIQDYIGLKKYEIHKVQSKIENTINTINVPDKIKQLAKGAITFSPTTILIGCGGKPDLDDLDLSGASYDEGMTGVPTIPENIGNLGSAINNEAALVVALLAIGYVYKVVLNPDKQGDGRWNDFLQGPTMFLGGFEVSRYLLDQFANIDMGPGWTAGIALGTAGAFTTWNRLRDR
jgi:hypothetical protein